MDLSLVNKGFDFTRKKKKWVFLLATFGVTGYGVYRVYNSPSIVKKRKKLLKLLSALASIVEVVSDSAETIGIISKDLKEFLESDSDEIPNSLKQVFKITQCEEFSDSVLRVTAALTRGIFRGYQAESRVNVGGDGVDSNSSFYDQFMDKLFSKSGTGFASVVVGSFARNLVLGFYSDENSDKPSNFRSKMNGDNLVSSKPPLPRWVEVVCDDRCKDLFGACIQTFVSTAVAVYLDKTMNVNTYDELFAGLTNPKHEKQVRDMLVSLCNGSIETLVKTSHQVLTSPTNSGQKPESDSSHVSRFVVTRSSSDVVSKTFYPAIDGAQNVITVKQNGKGSIMDIEEATKSTAESTQSGGWMSTVSSTLAEPSNRKFVLDVTGRVTFETVRSFLEFLLEKMFASVKRGVGVVNEAVVDTGLGVVRYVSAKASVVATLCLSLCLHILAVGTYALLPA